MYGSGQGRLGVCLREYNFIRVTIEFHGFHLGRKKYCDWPLYPPGEIFTWNGAGDNTTPTGQGFLPRPRSLEQSFSFRDPVGVPP